MILVPAAAAKNIKIVTADNMIEVRDFKDFLLLIPQEEQQGFELVRSGRLITAGGKILYAGEDTPESEALLKAFQRRAEEEKKEISLIREKGRGRYILPPFGDTHAHLAMTLFRGSPANYNLDQWLRKWIFPKEEKLSYEIVRAGADLAMLELMRCGCGAAADMYYFPEATAEAADQAGLRLNLSIDAKTKDEEGNFHQDADALFAFAEKYRSHPMIRPSFHIHSLYLYQDALYPELGRLAEAADLPVQIHLAETGQECEELEKKYNKSPAEVLDMFGLLRDGSLLAHCVRLDARDIRLLKGRKVYIAHNPASNSKLASGICDTEKLFDEGLHVTLGTDGAGSNDSLDMLRDLRLAAFLPKILHKRADAGAPERWLYAATAAAYEALGFKEAGRLKKGEAADFMIYNPDTPGSAPAGEDSDPFSLLVYAGNNASVERLTVNGRCIYKDGDYLQADEEKIIERAKAARKKLQ